MSKNKQYTNYRNMAKPVDEIAEVIAESNANVEVDVDDSASTNRAVEDVPAESLIGVVSDCKQLNVREKADINSAVVSVVSEGTVLVVEPESSTEEWFKIYTETGVEGFCMKKFVTTK